MLYKSLQIAYSERLALEGQQEFNTWWHSMPWQQNLGQNRL